MELAAAVRSLSICESEKEAALVRNRTFVLKNRARAFSATRCL